MQLNGGLLGVKPEAPRYIEGDAMWEHAATEGQLYAYQHEGFWQCMDTLRDLRYRESQWESGKPPRKTW